MVRLSYNLMLIPFIYMSVESCRNIRNLLVKVKDLSGSETNETLNGCIERKQFGDRKITSVFVRQQKISTLDRDSVRHLIHLNLISFWGCDLEKLEPLAFRNVPELKTVQFSYGNLNEIPKDVFSQIPKLEILRIHDNKIDFIENLAFANLTLLKKIFGGNNNLEYWNREWFEGSTELTVMDFQNNKIRTIPRRAFATMSKLKQIFFDYNQVETIQEEAFTGLKKLEYLGLRDNKLKELRSAIFPNHLKIDILLISYNQLNFISNEVLSKISAKTIELDLNPWKCPCLDRINYWIYTTNGTLRRSSGCENSNLPICAFPKSYSQTCLEYVDKELTDRYFSNIKSYKNEISCT